MLFRSYQDVWLNGKLIEKGERDCENRYNLIKKWIEKNLEPKFTVMDIGSNMAYFPIRLIEDFNCNAIAFEFHQYDKRIKIIKKQKTKNLMYVNRKISLNDLKLMSNFFKVDLIIATSVLHHVKEPVNEWIDAMKSISKYSIIELAGSDTDRAKNKVHNINYEIIGYGDSHLDNNYKRPIYII